MASPNESSMALACHPPYLNPPDMSSSGPAGACTTPSIVTKVVVTIFRVSGSLANNGVADLVSMSCAECPASTTPILIRLKAEQPNRPTHVVRGP
jgi:hypothetical protein